MFVRTSCAISCVVIGSAALAQAQSPATPPGVSGTGPGVSIQVGPNGTLDVGGARAGDLDLTGGNLLGGFGATRPQPAPTSPVAPPLNPPIPRAGFPALGSMYGQGLNGMPPAGLRTPGEAISDSFPRPGLEGREMGAPGEDLGDLILPRFRSALRGRWMTPHVAPGASVLLAPSVASPAIPAKPAPSSAPGASKPTRPDSGAFEPTF